MVCVDSAADANMEAWRETFDFFDPAHTGRISPEDLARCLQSFGQKVAPERVREMLREADLDRSGHVEFGDFAKVMSSDRARKVSEGAVKRYFESLDKDGSGYVTAAELRHAFTSLQRGLTDGEMDALLDRYDLDGNGVLTFDEFLALVADGNGIQVVSDAPEPFKPAGRAAAWPPAKVDKDEFVDVKDKKLAGVLKPLANAAGKVRLADLQAAVDLWSMQQGAAYEPERDPSLHWEAGRPKVGLGEVIHKANHISIVVADVGRSAAFYSDVIGLQQIRRPDFDRHGAWFTMGNMELHLIKGEPVVHSGQDLIVGHIALQTTNIDRVPEILTKAGVSFRQNVTVPAGVVQPGLPTNSSNNTDSVVKQYFLRDPDGYYVEISNCEVLAQYCLGDIQVVAGQDQGTPAHFAETAAFVHLAESLAHRAADMHDELSDLAAEFKFSPLAEIAERLGCKRRAPKADEAKLRRLLTRRTVFADICQNETEENIKEILQLADNHVPTAMSIMEIRGWDGALLGPPAYYEAGRRRVKPESFLLAKYSSAIV